MEQVVEIFPPTALDSSLLTAVLIGVVTVWVLSETLGWGMVGLVVPGYLAVVAIVRPVAAAVMGFEAILSFLIARGIMDFGRGARSIGPYFGRDRFFMILLVSIIVRQHCEHWFLPALAELVDPALARSLMVNRTLYSVGFVVVPLAANTFWNPGLRAGLPRLVVPSVIVYLVLVSLLLPATNLTLAEFELKYENLALEFVASPKTYIILLTGAYLSSWASRHFGWDVGGILVPALLGLLWLSPLRILATGVEAVGLAIVADLLVRKTYLGRLNIEGGRLTVFVFILGYVQKWVVTAVAARHFPAYPVQDLFGFGYLLTTLLAVSALRKRRIAQVVMPAFALSLVGFWAGSLAGFALDRLVPEQRVDARFGMTAGGRTAQRKVESQLSHSIVERYTRQLGQTPLGALAAARIRAKATEPPPLASTTAQQAYLSLWQGLARWSEQGGTLPADVGNAAEGLGLEIRGLRAPRAAVAVRPFTEDLDVQRGWHTAVLYPGARGPVIEVPYPARDRLATDAALQVCEHVECRAIVLAGVDTGAAYDPYGAFVRVAFDGVPLLQIRVRPSAPWRMVTDDVMAYHLAERALEAMGVVPEAVNYRVKQRPADENLRHAQTLVMPEDGVLKALRTDPLPVVEMHLNRWFRERGRKAPLHQVNYSPPSHTELNWLAEHIVPQVVDAAAREDETTLRWVAREAAEAGYSLTRLTHCRGVHRACLLLAESGAASRLGWGALAVAEGRGPDLGLEVPFPRGEDTHAIASALFSEGHARALVLADAELARTPEADPRGTPTRNVRNPFHAFHQGLVSAFDGRGAIVQLRALGAWRGLMAQVVVALDELILDPDTLPDLITGVIESGQDDGWLGPHVRYADGAADLLGLGGAGNLQIAHTRRAGLDVPVAVMYFDQPTRRLFSTRFAPAALRQLEFLGVEAITAESISALMDGVAPQRTLSDPPAPFKHALAIARAFAEAPSIERARALLRQTKAGFRLQVIEDPQRDVLALRLDWPGHRWRALLVVGPGLREIPQVTSLGEARAALASGRRGLTVRSSR